MVFNRLNKKVCQTPLTRNYFYIMYQNNTNNFSDLMSSRPAVGAMIFEDMPQGFFRDVAKARAADGPNQSVLFHFEYSGDLEELVDRLSGAGIELHDMYKELPDLRSQLPYRFAVEIPSGKFSTARQRLFTLFVKA